MAWLTITGMGKVEHAHAADATVIACSVDEPGVFAELFERHFSLVHRFLSVRVGGQEAGDLAAETFVVAFRRRADYDSTRPDARPWFARDRRQSCAPAVPKGAAPAGDAASPCA